MACALAISETVWMRTASCNRATAAASSSGNGASAVTAIWRDDFMAVLTPIAAATSSSALRAGSISLRAMQIPHCV